MSCKPHINAFLKRKNHNAPDDLKRPHQRIGRNDHGQRKAALGEQRNDVEGEPGEHEGMRPVAQRQQPEHRRGKCLAHPALQARLLW